MGIVKTVRRQAASHRPREHQSGTTETKQPMRSRTPNSFLHRQELDQNLRRAHARGACPGACVRAPLPPLPMLPLGPPEHQNTRTPVPMGVGIPQSTPQPPTTTQTYNQTAGASPKARNAPQPGSQAISCTSGSPWARTAEQTCTASGLCPPTTITPRNPGSRSRNPGAVKTLTVPRRAAGGRTAPPVYWMTNALT